MREEEDFAYTRPAFDAAAIAAQLRAAAHGAAARRSALTTDSSDGHANFNEKLTELANLPPLPPITLQPEFDAEARQYHVNDLLAFHDMEFVRNAYRALLSREPDKPGATAFLAALRSGQVNKLDVLAQLAASDEARGQDMRLDGLGGRARLRRFYRVPLIGYVLRLLVGIARLPQQQTYLQQLEAHLLAQQERLADYANALREQQATQTARAAAAFNAADAAQRSLAATIRNESQAAHAEQQKIFTAAHDKQSRIITEIRDEQQRNLAKVRDEQQRAIANVSAAANERIADVQSEVEMQAQLAQLRNEFSVSRQTEQARALEEIAGETRRQLAQLDAQQAAVTEDLRRQQATALGDLQRHGNVRVDELRQHSDTRVDELQWHLEALVSEQAEQARQQHSERENRLRALTDELRAAVEKVYLKQQELRAEFAQQGRQLNLIFESVDEQATQARGDTEIANLLPDAVRRVRDEARHTLDAFYVALEDRLRGSRDTVRERLKVYLPYVRAAGAGLPARPVLDLGCGRGEWLEILREEELAGSGIDTNRLSVTEARAHNLQVEEADILTYLRALPDESCGAVTCFHVVEHLSLETVLKVTEEVWRVLQRGGVAIFETPNPRNVLVGTCNFYYDPTHRNPVPSEVLQYIIESRGFAGVEVLPLNPSDAEPIKSDDETARRFNEFFYGAMDYAVVGKKSKV